MAEICIASDNSAVNDDRKTISSFLAGKNIFVTGGTGFLGTVLIERLLSSTPDIGKIYVLIRAKNGYSPESRIQNLMRKVVSSKMQISRLVSCRSRTIIKSVLRKANQRPRWLISADAKIVWPAEFSRTAADLNVPKKLVFWLREFRFRHLECLWRWLASSSNWGWVCSASCVVVLWALLELLIWSSIPHDLLNTRTMICAFLSKQLRLPINLQLNSSSAHNNCSRTSLLNVAFNSADAYAALLIIMSKQLRAPRIM